MWKAVIFDMDGLMFDTEFLVVKAWDKVGQDLGVGKLGFMINKALGTNADKTRELFYEEFKGKVDYDQVTKLSREYIYDYYDKNGIPVKEGLYELLDYLKEKNYKLAVASSSRRESVLHHLEDAKVTDYFDAIVCGDMIKNSKPAPDIYLKAAEELGVDPSECIALEDSPNGIRSANNAGMKVIMVPDLVEPDKEISDIIYLKLDNLKQAIKVL